MDQRRFWNCMKISTIFFVILTQGRKCYFIGIEINLGNRLWQTDSHKLEKNKKFLLREPKRPTVRRVASACFADEGGTPGYPLPAGWGTPVQTWDGIPPILTWDGVPPIWTWNGVPPVLTWDGVPPLQTWDGVLPHLDLGWDTPPPPTSVDRLKILPSLILRMRAVIRKHLFLC